MERGSPTQRMDARFRRTVRAFYRTHGRHELPWRKTHDPYRIMVSELMLQQTQVERVIPKYEAFIKHFPNVRALARAELGDVLRLWQGLGYNRRAKHLHAAARALAERGGVFPRDHRALTQLPGIGAYTASAILAFAFDIPTPLIETNVRTVVLHHYFPMRDSVDDREVYEIVARTLPKTNAREWYAALMDYGTHLKKTIGNINTRSRHYSKQSRFQGSDRQIRGAILRVLHTHAHTRASLEKALTKFASLRVSMQLDALQREGMVQKEGRQYRM